VSLKYVLQPIAIGSCTVPNRVVFPAHTTNFGRGALSDDLIAYHEARARGGVGLSILEILAVHPSSPASLRAWDKGLLDTYRTLMSAVRPYGMRVFQQLWHGGHHVSPRDGSPPWSASDVPSVREGVVPRPMSRGQIREIVEAFARAARLCEEAGLDGVEVHGAHGYLLQQFMSPLTNRRTDEYGGSFENRIRFTVEVLRAVRSAVSRGFAVGIRLSPEVTPGGLDPEENARIVRALQDEALVDFVDVSMGGYLAFPKLVGALHEPAGYELQTSIPITAAADVPTIVTGRFRTLEEADTVIRDGHADLVGMARANIADPDLVAKTRQGRALQVRPCIGCNQGCVGGLFGPAARVSCTVNSAVGRERLLGEDRLRRVGKPKRVLVVGGGPAGLEAARVAALRGHRVTLMEARSKLGGTLNLVRSVPRLQGLCDIIDWQKEEIGRLGVEVHTNTYVEAAEILEQAPDTVIIATGSTPRMDGVQSACPGRPARGIQRPHVISSIELLSVPDRPLGRTALVLDDAGHYEGIAVAEYLVEKGVEVTFVTPHREFAPLMEPALRAHPALERLSRGRFHLITRAILCEVFERDAEIQYIYGGTPLKVPAELVIFISHNRPDHSLREALWDYPGEVLVVGDANSPRFLNAAIREGYMAGSSI
jgi:2,4-dienoyl-CoA reductase-like NADH-dependent reductase (Old Yellow Enzyme family)